MKSSVPPKNLKKNQSLLIQRVAAKIFQTRTNQFIRREKSVIEMSSERIVVPVS